MPPFTGSRLLISFEIGLIVLARAKKNIFSVPRFYNLCSKLFPSQSMQTCRRSTSPHGAEDERRAGWSLHRRKTEGRLKYLRAKRQNMLNCQNNRKPESPLNQRNIYISFYICYYLMKHVLSVHFLLIHTTNSRYFTGSSQSQRTKHTAYSSLSSFPSLSLKKRGSRDVWLSMNVHYCLFSEKFALSEWPSAWITEDETLLLRREKESHKIHFILFVVFCR